MGTVAHSVVLDASVDLPVGVLLAVALSVSVHTGLLAAWPSQAVALAAVLGWGLAVFAGLSTGPGGDFLLARPLDGIGMAWLVAGPGALALSTAVVRRAVLAPPAWPTSA